MKIVRFEVNLFGENTYVLFDEDSKDAIVVDPGMMADSERDAVERFLKSSELHLQKIILTHAHVDHVASAAWLAAKYNTPIYASEADAPLAEALPEQVKQFHLKIQLDPLHIDHYLKEGDVLKLAADEIKVLEVPGHSPGGLAYYVPSDNLIITGDSIFPGSIGRTDLYGGSQQQLVASVKSKIMTLPLDTMIVPGHGPTTTVGQEKNYNPYLY